MKKSLLIFIPIIIVLTAMSGVFLYNLRDTNAALSSSNAENARLSTENSRLTKELKRFEGVDMSQLLKICKEKSSNDSMQYIRDNSIASKEGNSTSYIPKSSEVLTKADRMQADADNVCENKYGR